MSSVGAKRLTGGRNVLNLGQVVTATGAERLEDGCETSRGAKRLWCEMSRSHPVPTIPIAILSCST